MPPSSKATKPIARSFALAVLPLSLACSSSDQRPDGGRFVRGLSVTGAALYQAVEIPIGQDGVPAGAPPVVEDRPALLRFFVEPEAGWEPRGVAAELRLAGETPLVDERSIEIASSNADLASTFNFELSADQMRRGLSFSLVVLEVEDGRGAQSGARFPDQGASQPPVATAGDGLDIVIVPYRYAADGSNRLPALSALEVARLEARVFELFPTSEVRVRLREPVALADPVQPLGDGWGAWLADLLALRATDGARPDEYYFGVATPAASLDAYCSGGCTTGLSPSTVDPSDEYPRGAVGLAFEDGAGNTEIGNILVHELGHLHGRSHAPCPPGTPSVDESYPYADAGIGTWGYALGDHVLIDPAGTARDLMGYCQPYWISDYTYGEIHRWTVAVEGAAPSGTAQARWTVVAVDAHGRRGSARQLALWAAPTGRRVDARVDGAAVGSVPGYFYPFNHLPGGLLLVSHLVLSRLPGARLATRPLRAP